MTLPLAHHRGCSCRVIQRRPRQSLPATAQHTAFAALASHSSAISALHPVLLCPYIAASGSVQLRAAADRMPYAGTGLKPLMQS